MEIRGTDGLVKKYRVIKDVYAGSFEEVAEKEEKTGKVLLIEVNEENENDE